MIPSDVVSRLQTSVTDTTHRATPQSQELSDKLSDLVAGQKVMAEIQAVLPNGIYRAVINQRNITLALPFSAQAGDSLELLVTESEGKVALAVVAHKQGENTPPSKDGSVSATLSKTGQLISDLLSEAQQTTRTGQAGKSSMSLVLNENQPIAQTTPNSAEEILPQLKQAITTSGMFYESHQAEWVEGKLTTQQLLQEPQGKLSTPAAIANAKNENNQQINTQTSPNTQQTQAPQNSPTTPALTGAMPSDAPAASNLIAAQTQQIVQQQLVALANQQFSWQGQIWPGQEMRWDIQEEQTPAGTGQPENSQWTTSLQLDLPNLGGIVANISIYNGELNLSIKTELAATREIMHRESSDLRHHMAGTGLSLASLGIDINTITDDGSEEK